MEMTTTDEKEQKRGKERALDEFGIVSSSSSSSTPSSTPFKRPTCAMKPSNLASPDGSTSQIKPLPSGGLKGPSAARWSCQDSPCRGGN